MGSCVVSLSRVFRARKRSRVEYIPRERGCGLWLVPTLLRQIIRELQRPRFGRRAESLPEDQLLLGLEESEQVEAEALAREEPPIPPSGTMMSKNRKATLTPPEVVSSSLR
jgi:hypothetical protein